MNKFSTANHNEQRMKEGKRKGKEWMIGEKKEGWRRLPSAHCMEALQGQKT